MLVGDRAKKNVLQGILAAVLSLFLTACHFISAPVRDQKIPPFHVVSKGESLYSIAWQYGQDFRLLARQNQLKEPYRIYPGQKLKLTSHPKSSTQKLSSLQESSKTQSFGVETEKKLLPKVADVKSVSDQNHKFLWPAQGKIIQGFDLENGEKGIDIAGDLNQPIQAVAEGKVVYSGQGLLGYGNLIIIKHDDEFLSAYAHNQTALVREGDKIKQGAVIATMGKTGTDRVKLHFELRRGGKPTDPLHYLPQR